MRRFLGITVGLLVQALFVYASYYNYVFLAGAPPRPGGNYLAWDALLAIQFCVVHSVLLAPPVKKWLGRWISPAFYGLFFCTAACLTLLLTMFQWQVGDWASGNSGAGPASPCKRSISAAGERCFIACSAPDSAITPAGCPGGIGSGVSRFRGGRSNRAGRFP